MKKSIHRLLTLAGVVTALAAPRPAHATNGHLLHGIGPVNEALGGAGIATSIDAIGSNANNVSSIAFIDGNSIEFGAGVFIPDRSYFASVAGFAAGSVSSQTDAAVLPSFGIVYHLNDSWTFGFTGVGIAGFGVNYPANLPNGSGNFNPLAVPQSFGGFGAVYSSYQLLQMTPSVSYRILPELSVGVGADIDWSALGADPFPATPPNTSGYPTATHTASAWGGGFTLGADYKALSNLALGLVFKSPQWFNSFQWVSQYPDGTPTHLHYNLGYPLVAGAGLSYLPADKWLLASDVKWINYSDTQGFSKGGFASTPQGPYVRGFGWNDIWTVGLGAQYQALPALALRLGYNYGQSPISSDNQFINVFAPAIVEHHLTAGLGIKLTSQITINLAYYHGFENSESGPVISPGRPGYPPINQPVPGTKVTNTLSEDSVSMQVAVKF